MRNYVVTSTISCFMLSTLSNVVSLTNALKHGFRQVRSKRLLLAVSNLMSGCYQRTINFKRVSSINASGIDNILQRLEPSLKAKDELIPE